MNKLSIRLQAAYDLLKPCDSIIEIGCGHCWLSIFLVKNGKVKKAIASDINEEPLESCKTNIRNTGNLNIETYISDGFKSIDKNFDSVIITGMGGKLICSILNQRKDLKNKQLVLQPQKNEHILRKYLKNEGYKINDEVVVEDSGFIYTIISVFSEGYEIIDNIDIHIGPILKQNRQEFHITKHKNHLKHLKSFIPHITECVKLKEIKTEINAITKFLEE